MFSDTYRQQRTDQVICLGESTSFEPVTVIVFARIQLKTKILHHLPWIKWQTYFAFIDPCIAQSVVQLVLRRIRRRTTATLPIADGVSSESKISRMVRHPTGKRNARVALGTSIVLTYALVHAGIVRSLSALIQGCGYW